MPKISSPPVSSEEEDLLDAMAEEPGLIPVAGEVGVDDPGPKLTRSSNATNSSKRISPCFSFHLLHLVNKGPPTSTHRKNGRLMNASISADVSKSRVTKHWFHRSVA